MVALVGAHYLTFLKSKYKCLSIIPNDSIFWSNYNNDYSYYSNLSTINEFDLKYKTQNLEGSTLGLDINIRSS